MITHPIQKFNCIQRKQAIFCEYFIANRSPLCESYIALHCCAGEHFGCNGSNPSNSRKINVLCHRHQNIIFPFPAFQRINSLKQNVKRFLLQKHLFFLKVMWLRGKWFSTREIVFLSVILIVHMHRSVWWTFKCKKQGNISCYKIG